MDLLFPSSICQYRQISPLLLTLLLTIADASLLGSGYLIVPWFFHKGQVLTFQGKLGPAHDFNRGNLQLNLGGGSGQTQSARSEKICTASR